MGSLGKKWRWLKFAHSEQSNGYILITRPLEGVGRHTTPVGGMV